MKKYEFTGETIKVNGIELKQIRRLSDNLIGGYIEKEENLSHSGNCFVYGNARVYGDAEVYGNARVYEYAEVYGKARVCGYAEVFRKARVCGSAIVHGEACVYGDAEVYGNARVYGGAEVCGNAEVYGNAKVYGNAEVYGKARVCGKVRVYGKVQVEFKEIEFYQKHNSRLVTAIKTLDDQWVFNVGCQSLISKETFLERINSDGGIEENPHREFYLKILELF